MAGKRKIWENDQKNRERIQGEKYGLLDFYADNEQSHPRYDDWFWKDVSKKYPKRNQSGIRIPNKYVYEK